MTCTKMLVRDYALNAVENAARYGGCQISAARPVGGDIFELETNEGRHLLVDGSEVLTVIAA
jgi:hypothetical protein